MKNLLKKIAVITASMMLALTTFALPSFAATQNPGTVVEITGLDANNAVTATAYKIVKQKNDGSWESIYPNLFTVPANGDVTIEQSDIEALAKEAQKGSLDGSKVAGDFTRNGTKLTKDLAGTAGLKYGTENNKGAGMYLVLLENGATMEGKVSDDSAVRVFNPIILSVDPSGDNGSLMAGSVGAGEKYSNSAVAKSSKPSFDKYIIRANANKNGQDLTDTTNLANSNVTNENKYGDTDTKGSDSDSTVPKVGSKVWFEITTTIPAYADNYWYTDSNGKAHAPTFKIFDTLSTGLDLQDDELEVFVGGSKVDPSTATKKTWTIETSGQAGAEQSYTITFDSDYLKGLGQKDVEVRYPAVVNENCKSNFDAETNTAHMEYTHKPGSEQSSDEITTYHYTFSINGKINGEGSTELREVVKVGANKEGDFVFAESTKVDEGWTEDIEGAVFELFKADTSGSTWQKADNNVIRTATSGKDGRLQGLDRLDAGNYVLVEKSVPSPYKVNNSPIPVKIEAALADDGVLESYKITINNIVAGNYEATYKDANKITEIKALKDDGTVLATYVANQAMATNASQLTTIERKTGETDEAYQARVAEYLKTFNDVHTEAADIRNTETGTLPSTGGMGTILFTIGGIILIGLAFLLLFGGRRKQHQK